MAHRLKTVHYQNASRSILLQNENGPCPLLAIANALLLKGALDLPSKCVRNGAASIEDVVNVLAERATALSEARRGGNGGEGEWTEVTGKTRGKGEAKTEAAGGSSPKEGSHARVEEGAGGSSSAFKSSPIAKVGGAASDALKSGAASPGDADAVSPGSAGSDGPSKGSAAPGAVPCSSAASKNGGWIKATDPKTGRAFYANATTRTTQWDKPSGFVDDDDAPTASSASENESPGAAASRSTAGGPATVEAADGSAHKKAGSANATPENANDMEAASSANTTQSATTDNAMKGSSDGSPPSFDPHAHHLHELLSLLPSLASGMDVNPTFTKGPTGYEYTANTSTFDILGIDLVHGWLLDTGDCVGNEVEKKYREVVGHKSYNEVIECVIKGHEAQEQLERLDGKMEELEKRLAELSIEVVVDGERHQRKSSSSGQPEKENKADQGVSLEEEKKEGAAVARAEQEGGNPSEAAMEEASAESADGDSEEKKESSRPLSESEKEWVEVTKEDEQCCEPSVAIATTTGEKEQNGEEGAVANASVTERNAPTTTTAAPPPTPSDIQKEMEELRHQRDELTVVATDGAILKDFLDSTSHQLTYHGLHELHNFLAEEALVVFFRNNHFATMTKHDGILYLLVTDLGYANVSEVMWEKLDDIDGDTEYYDERFVKPAPRADLSPAAGPTLSPEQLLAQGGQANADYHLAMQLSKEGHRPAGGGGGKSPSGKRGTASLDEQEGRLMAAATEASLIEWNQRENGYLSQHSSSIVDNPSSKEDVTTGAPSAPIDDDDQALARSLQAQMDSDLESERLARRLQEEENRYAAASRRTDAAAGSRSAAAESNESNKSNCVIS